MTNMKEWTWEDIYNVIRCTVIGIIAIVLFPLWGIICYLIAFLPIVLFLTNDFDEFKSEFIDSEMWMFWIGGIVGSFLHIMVMRFL